MSGEHIKYFSYEVELDDSDGNDPRDWDNTGCMVCFHGKYNLGDDTDYTADMFDSWDELKDRIILDHAPITQIQPLYLYDHSGITMSTSPFSCRWDSGQVGWIFTCEKDAKQSWLEGEVETYSKYLEGEVYWYGVYEHVPCSEGDYHTELVESCGGFFDVEQAEAEAKALKEDYEQKESEEE